MKNHISFLVRHYILGWKQSIKQKNKIDIGLFDYWFIWGLLIMMNSAEEIRSVKECFFYFILILPITLGWFHSFLFPNALNKTFFLSPMGKQERIRFLNTLYRFRIVCVMLLSFLISAVFVVFGIVKGSWYFLGLFLSEGMLADCLFLRMKNVTIENAGQKGLLGYLGWSIFGWIIGILSCTSFAISIITYTGTYFSTGILLFFLLLQTISCVKINISYRNRIMDIATDYEKSFLSTGEKK